MPTSYVNRRGQTYYLHLGRDKAGGPMYYFSLKQEGAVADIIPPGMEIYEHPNGQVFVRRPPVTVINDDEVAIVEQEVARFSHLKCHAVDVRKDAITVYVPCQDMTELERFYDEWGGIDSLSVQEEIERTVSLSPMMRFVLVDAEKRTFEAYRYCFLGSVDDWIHIGGSDTLSHLAGRYIKHLGRDSYYNLYLGMSGA
jgi:hypothetical protein